MHYIWHILQTLHQVQNYSFPHGLFNRLIRTASKCFSNTHGCFLRAIWWGWEKMRSWRRRTRTSRWGPEGWREDKSLWVGCVQGEIRQTDRSELRVLALLSSRSCSSTPGRWGPSTPVTQSTANLRAAQNELHGRAWSRSAPCCFPWESCTPPVCSQLYSLWALWPSPGEDPGVPGFVLPVLLVMLLAAAQSLCTGGTWLCPLWTSLPLAPFILVEGTLSQTCL